MSAHDHLSEIEHGLDDTVRNLRQILEAVAGPQPVAIDESEPRQAPIGANDRLMYIGQAVREGLGLAETIRELLGRRDEHAEKGLAATSIGAR